MAMDTRQPVDRRHNQCVATYWGRPQHWRAVARHLAADTALQIEGGVATLAGVVLAESINRNPPLL
ncbi:MAG: hypothetical protein H7831_06280 [Magnetococcus sp. WYHC-3]